MKIKLDNYTFNPAAKTVTFTDYASLDLSDVILITNVTDGTIIFNFASPNLVGSVAANVLTLNYDTSAMSSTDRLAIYLDDSYTPSSDEAIALLRRMVKLMEPLAVQDVSQRQRVTVDAITSGITLSTIQTVSSVNNIGAIGNIDPRYQFIDQARNAYANGIRANITNS
jgi:hypothetical protein